MTSFNEIKKSNDKFLNDFGVKFGDAFIPKCVNEDFVTVKDTLTKINSKVNVNEMIDDLIYTYDVLNESRKNNFPQGYFRSLLSLAYPEYRYAHIHLTFHLFSYQSGKHAFHRQPIDIENP